MLCIFAKFLTVECKKIPFRNLENLLLSLFLFRAIKRDMSLPAQLHIPQRWRNQGGKGVPRAPQDFSRSVSPISTRGTGYTPTPQHYSLPRPQIFRPSAITVPYTLPNLSRSKNRQKKIGIFGLLN